MKTSNIGHSYVCEGLSAPNHWMFIEYRIPLPWRVISERLLFDCGEQHSELLEQDKDTKGLLFHDRDVVSAFFG
jgi:hypothetical protein